MHRLRVALLVASLGLSAFPARATELPPSPTAAEAFELGVVTLITEQLETIEKDGCGTAYDKLLDRADDALFETIPNGAREMTAVMAALCVKLAPSPRGAALIRRLEPLVKEPSARGLIEHALIRDAIRRNDLPEAARRLVALIDVDPATPAGWRLAYVSQIVGAAEGDPDLSLALLSRVTRLDWRDEASREAARNYWAFRYAGRLADRGDLAAARQALKPVESAFVLMRIAQDGRFRSFWPEFEREGRFDWRKGVEGDLAAVARKREAEPALLVHPKESIALLRALGRYNEAIALGEGYRIRLRSNETFNDRKAEANWLLNELGYALLDVGRVAEAQPIFEAAIAIGETGGNSISQRVNWAAMLNDQGRPTEALATLDGVKPAGSSPYGQMWVLAERVCAHAQLTPADAAAPFERLRKDWEENPAALTRALLCLDRQDEVASLYVRRLASPRHRATALSAFRLGSQPPAAPARAVDLERRRRAAIDRPEVVEALKSVGRGLNLPLASIYWGDL